jgi:hypothetical protein
MPTDRTNMLAELAEANAVMAANAAAASKVYGLR